MKHPRMTLENRAKIFSPFAALRGYEQKVAEEGRKIRRIEKQLLSDGEQEKLSEKLSQLRKGAEVSVTFFVPEEDTIGTYQELTGRVEGIDAVAQTLQICNQAIAFEYLWNIGIG